MADADEAPTFSRLQQQLPVMTNDLCARPDTCDVMLARMSHGIIARCRLAENFEITQNACPGLKS